MTTNKLTELNTKMPVTEPTIEEKITELQEILEIADRISTKLQIAHARIENERIANK